MEKGGASRPFSLHGRTDRMSYCFVFICQQGELEVKSLLLAASLRRHLRCDHELVAAIPHPESTWGAPAPDTLALLQRLGVRTVPIENPIDPGYPIGNKLACLGVETTADKMVFLDSDMLCLRDFAGGSRFERSPVNVKPADLATFGADLQRWQSAYAAHGLTVPDSRVLSTVSGETMPPYFNAGFIAAHRDSGLAAEWIAAARAIEADPAVPDKRPWLDQVALPVAMAKRGLVPDCLDERFNFPAHLKPLDAAALPWFCHYHSPDVLRREPVANAQVDELAEEHPELRHALESRPEWKVLLAPYRLSPGSTGAAPPPDSTGMARGPSTAHAVSPQLIVTGIPRSGTSFLCKLIHGMPDCVVINEPREVFAPLAGEPIPWGVALRYGELRRDILDGQPVMNKLHRGEFIEDTAEVDTLEPYNPQVSRPDFLLGTKNTLAYLGRLAALRRAMPHAGIAACVRHPLDTIASWKSTFPHLANADMESQRVGHSGDRFVSGLQRERLREIAATARPAIRRALLWRYLAEIVLDHRDRIAVLRYEDLVTDPAAALARVFAATPHMFAVDPGQPLQPSSVRQNRDALDASDYEAVSGICAQAAAALGYDFP
jgi:hypothetical protein